MVRTGSLVRVRTITVRAALAMRGRVAFVEATGEVAKCTGLFIL